MFVSRYRKEGVKVSTKSRADYFKERRKKTKAFYVELDREKMELFEQKLQDEQTTKKEWLEEKIDKELNK